MRWRWDISARTKNESASKDEDEGVALLRWCWIPCSRHRLESLSARGAMYNNALKRNAAAMYVSCVIIIMPRMYLALVTNFTTRRAKTYLDSKAYDIHKPG